MLGDERGQLLLMVEPEADDRHHADPALRAGSAKSTETASTNVRTRGSSHSAIACGGAAPDQPAVVQDADAIGQRHRLGHVVRDEDDALRDSRAWMRRNSLLQLAARDRIERAERLVHQQHRRIGGQRARDADALTLSAGQLVGPAARIGLRRRGRSARAARARARRRDRLATAPAAARRRCCRRRSDAETGRRPE